MEQHEFEAQFVVCIRNDGYSASLEQRKIYQAIPDERAAQKGFIRVVDESDEDYLYPADYFVPIVLPEALEKVFALTSHP